jgi:hypothetical protein
LPRKALAGTPGLFCDTVSGGWGSEFSEFRAFASEGVPGRFNARIATITEGRKLPKFIMENYPPTGFQSPWGLSLKT